jgi:glc operon protein GlcG
MLANDHYIVACAHRTASTHAETHLTNTDLFYIVEGSATLVTGGEIVAAFEESPGEIRGERINGGSEHPLTKGSIIVIPKGTPHWFSDIEGPLLYYVVRVLE